MKLSQAASFGKLVRRKSWAESKPWVDPTDKKFMKNSVGYEEMFETDWIAQDIQIINFRNEIDKLKNKLIREALEKCGNSRNMASKLLMIQRTTLLAMIRALNIDAPRQKRSKE